MRVNVYNEELTQEVQIAHTEPAPGRNYIGLRFMLESADELHHTATDDDRSAVTLWVGSHPAARRLLVHALDAIVADELEQRNQAEVQAQATMSASPDARSLDDAPPEPMNTEAVEPLESLQIGRVVGNMQVRISTHPTGVSVEIEERNG